MQGTGTVFPMDTSLLHSVGKKSQQEERIEGDRLAHLWGRGGCRGTRADTGTIGLYS